MKAYQLYFYVPLENAEDVKNALFEIGLGRLGDYECCAFEIRGQGQFLPKQGSRPFIGRLNQLERLEELKVEIFCPLDLKDQALKTLKETHPYEEPAFGFIQIEIA